MPDFFPLSLSQLRFERKSGQAAREIESRLVSKKTESEHEQQEKEKHTHTGTPWNCKGFIFIMP